MLKVIDRIFCMKSIIISNIKTNNKKKKLKNIIFFIFLFKKNYFYF